MTSTEQKHFWKGLVVPKPSVHPSFAALTLIPILQNSATDVRGEEMAGWRVGGLAKNL